jgi:hypothetical protein
MQHREGAMKMSTESLETQASIMLKNAADHLAGAVVIDTELGSADYLAVVLLDQLANEVYFSKTYTFGEPLY